MRKHVWKILGMYEGNLECVDWFETKKEAIEMLHEYRMAFGSGWNLYVKGGYEYV